MNGVRVFFSKLGCRWFILDGKRWWNLKGNLIFWFVIFIYLVIFGIIDNRELLLVN